MIGVNRYQERMYSSFRSSMSKAGAANIIYAVSCGRMWRMTSLQLMRMLQPFKQLNQAGDIDKGWYHGEIPSVPAIFALQ
ncbi:MAG: hypothetical protein Q7J78_05180 [Clostridiales bacterium]|nr:hypothetical protein [Clostridiales bacterium]